MDFFDKINNNTIVDGFKQISETCDREVSIGTRNMAKSLFGRWKVILRSCCTIVMNITISHVFDCPRYIQRTTDIFSLCKISCDSNILRPTMWVLEWRPPPSWVFVGSDETSRDTIVFCCRKYTPLMFGPIDSCLDYLSVLWSIS